MKRLLLLILLLQCFSLAESQLRFVNVDSIKVLMNRAAEDTVKVMGYANICFTYAFLQVDSGILYGQKAISLARKIQYKNGEAAGTSSYGWSLWASGIYDKAIESALASLKLYKELGNYDRVTAVYEELAVFYRDAGDLGEALEYGIQSKKLYDSLKMTDDLHGLDPHPTLALIYLFKNQLDSASFYISMAYEKEKEENAISGYTLDVIGNVEAKKKNYTLARNYYHSAIATSNISRNYFDKAVAYTLLAQLYQETGKMDSSLWYAKEVISRHEYGIFQRSYLDALTVLAQDYKQMQFADSALKYLELRVALNDSLFNKEKSRAIQAFTFNEELQQQEIEAARMQYQSRVKFYTGFAFSAVLLMIGIILYRNNKIKQKANVLLQQQKEKVETALSSLEATQSQLIQSEKMASLGELTAGIAHEIQNPLNFVNNFSEVNEELIEELEQEADKGNLDEIRMIAKSIKENEQKISYHGKRADAIVRGMLQHSRTSKGVKEPTDINALADEYLRLAYHGLRAKDKTFNATMKTDFDGTIGNVPVIPQDFGRVLLNLFNNAFYAVNEKQKESGAGFEPTVSLTTLKVNGRAEIRVRDNGNGIPPKLLDKIFQPFFTTKPTGQGTGLGLSLSYDIVKAHGGEIQVDSKEGAFTEFRISLNI